jgi:hypothetical protein
MDLTDVSVARDGRRRHRRVRSFPRNTLAPGHHGACKTWARPPACQGAASFVASNAQTTRRFTNAAPHGAQH